MQINNFKSFLTILLIVFSLSIHAQLTFQKTYGGTNSELAFFVQQTTDGGYIITGHTSSFGAGSYDVYLIKTNANGDTLWTKTFGGTSNDMAYSIQQTNDGGYIITGNTNSFGAGNSDVYLIKTDANGNSLWAKTFGGTGNDYGYSVQQTTGGGYIITGITYSFGAGSEDVYLIRTDANGDSLWTKTFGGIGLDEGKHVVQTSDGGYIISGLTGSFGAGSYDLYLIKTDVNGNSLWTKTLGGTGQDEGRDVRQTSDGGYIISGLTTSFGAGGSDVYLLKTDINGVLLWAKTYGGSGTDIGNASQQTSDGGYIVAGTTDSSSTGKSDIYLIKTDNTGNSLWRKTFGGTNLEYVFSCQQTTDGGYIIAGHTRSFGSGFQNVYLIKTDVIGNSGCNQSNTTMIVTTPTTTVTNPATQISSGAIVGSPVTTKGNGGIVNTLCTTTGISEKGLMDSFVTIFPNPFSTQTILQTDILLSNATLSVNNCLGQTIKQIKNISGNTVTLLRDNLASGLYYIHLMQGDKVISTNKLIITDN
jgi:hypothetical protein